MIYLIVVQNRSLDFNYSLLYDKIKSIDDYIQAIDNFSETNPHYIVE